MTTAISEEQREALLRKFFKFVLHTPEPDPKWIESWVAITAQDAGPEEMFDRFTSSRAVREHLAREADIQTRWPHGHFYSPVVSRAEARKAWDAVARRSPAAGIDLNDVGQQALFEELAPFINAYPFPQAKQPDFRYFEQNPSYSFGDACIYWAMLNKFKPRQIIEVGSGFTSALALDTIDRLGLPTGCTFIDPFPEVVKECTSPLGPQHTIEASRVQDMSLEIFDELAENDILFVDSSHVAKFGSDVQFEFTQIYPRLKSGVIIHIHDIFWPFEYHKNWILQNNHSWNELYFVQAFLMYNSAFKIQYFNHYFARQHSERLRLLRPEYKAKIDVNPGGGLWLRRE